MISSNWLALFPTIGSIITLINTERIIKLSYKAIKHPGETEKFLNELGSLFQNLAKKRIPKQRITEAVDTTSTAFFI